MKKYKQTLHSSWCASISGSPAELCNCPASEEEFIKPSIEQTAWVIKHILKHFEEGGSFRYLIYDRMGYGQEAYVEFYEAGGLKLSNMAYELKQEREKYLKNLK